MRKFPKKNYKEIPGQKNEHINSFQRKSQNITKMVQNLSESIPEVIFHWRMTIDAIFEKKIDFFFDP